MIPYLLFILLLLFFRNYKQHQLMFVTMVLFSALRYDVGWDFMSYYGIVRSWGQLTISMEHYSFIWAFLFRISQQLNAPQIAIAVPAIITISLIYFVISKLQVSASKVCDSLAVYALWPFFYLLSFSVIRQSLAISVGLLIFYCAIRKRYLPFFFLLVLNFYIHQSSLVCVAFGVFFFDGFKLKNWQILLIAVLFTIVARSLGVILNNSLVEDYLTYVGESDTYGTKLSILIAMILIPVLIIRTKSSIVKRLCHPGVIDVVVLSYIIAIIIYVLVNNSVLSRVLDYFLVLLVFVLPETKQLFKEKKLATVLIYGALSMIFLVYLIITSGAQDQGLASSSFLPYKTILFSL